jgi:hypothetical protein
MKTQLASFLAVFLAAGCSTLITDALELPETARARQAMKPVAATLAVCVQAAEQKAARQVQDDSSKWSVPWSALPIGDEIVRDLRRFGMFENVVLLEEGTSNPAEAARAAGAGFCLVVRPRDVISEYLGPNAWIIPNLLIWACVLVPCWYVPDETYRVAVSLEGSLIDVRSGRTIRSFPFEGSVEMNLGDTLRGLDFFTGVYGPVRTLVLGPPRESSCVEAADSISNLALNAAKADLFGKLAGCSGELLAAKAAPATEPPPPERGPSCFAIVVGAGSSEGQGARFAGSDAKSVSGLPGALAGWRLPDKNLTLLLGASATADAVRKAIGKLGKAGLGKDDSVFFHFSGLGALSGGDAPKAWLVPSGGSSQSLDKTCISVGEIAAALSGTGAGRVVIAVDAGFSVEDTTEMDGRSLGLAGGGALQRPTGAEFLSPALASRKGLCVFLAAGAGRDAVEMKETGGGLFTSAFAEGLKGAADGNKDRSLTASELAEFIRQRVAALAARYALDQAPVFLGDDGAILAADK